MNQKEEMIEAIEWNPCWNEYSILDFFGVPHEDKLTFFSDKTANHQDGTVFIFAPPGKSKWAVLPGDYLCRFSDGIVHAMNAKRLLEIVREISPKNESSPPLTAIRLNADTKKVERVNLKSDCSDGLPRVDAFMAKILV